MIGSILTHTLNGVYYGAILFMIASGLTIIFGILGILNLAHGELYALGAFLGVSVLQITFNIIPTGDHVIYILVIIGALVIGVILAALITIPFGYVFEAYLLKPIYHREDYYQLLLTFGVLLILVDIMKFIWGPSPRSTSGPYREINSIPLTEFVGLSYPTYNIFVIIFATVLFIIMMLFFNKAKAGRLIRATAINKEMAASIGIDTKRTFTLVFVLGVVVAGLGGALAAPPIAASLHMGIRPLILAFVVLVVGGIGSVHGAFVAAMIVGVISRWAVWLYPPIELAAPFVIMAIILLVKPEGLFKSWGEFE